MKRFPFLFVILSLFVLTTCADAQGCTGGKPARPSGCTGGMAVAPVIVVPVAVVPAGCSGSAASVGLVKRHPLKRLLQQLRHPFKRTTMCVIVAAPVTMPQVPAPAPATAPAKK